MTHTNIRKLNFTVGNNQKRYRFFLMKTASVWSKNFRTIFIHTPGLKIRGNRAS